VQLSSPLKNKKQNVAKRKFSKEAVTSFKNHLSEIRWFNVLQENYIDKAYDEFWEIFKTAYDINFPVKTVKFNRNIHKINNFMTSGLLTSRKTKNYLHKKSLVNPSPENLQKYRVYRNAFARVLRESKKSYYAAEFKKHSKNPKKNLEFN